MPKARAKPRRRGPGERAGLDLATVLGEARAICAGAGVAALTMRSLAARLGVAPNALYSHFADKSALLDALLDALLADVEVPDLTGLDWQTGLRALMRSTRRLLLAHADLVPLFLSRPTRGPHALRLGEATLALLARAGLAGQDAVDALRILLIFSFGFAAQEAPRRAEPAPAARRAKSQAAFGGARDLPHLRSLAEPLAEHPNDATFEKGLSWLLAGIGGEGHHQGFRPQASGLSQSQRRSRSRKQPGSRK